MRKLREQWSLSPRHTQFTSSRLWIQPLSCSIPELLTTVQQWGACRIHIETTFLHWLGARMPSKGHLRWASPRAEDWGFGLRLEKRRESSAEDPSHPGLASFISVTSFRGVEWGGRKRKGNCLPKLPFPSSLLGLLQSNLPQMARAFNVHKVEVA